MNSTGPRNLITDVAGISVGHAHDEKLASGVTVVLAESAAVTAATIFGGGPGTRELDAIDLGGSVGAADAIVLSGGSAFGLDAASGVQAFLREAERGFSVGPVRVPIVPQAILFDLVNGGDKVWGRRSPYHELGFQAAASAGKDFALGSAGAGLGTIVSAGEGRLIRGGLGSASEAVPGLASVEGSGCHCRGIGGGERGRFRDRRGHPSFLGGSIRTGSRVRRPWLSASMARACVAAGLQICGARACQYDALRCGNRRRPHSPAMQAARDHGWRRHGTRHLSGFLLFRRRYRFRPCDGQNASQGPANGPSLDRRGGGKLPDARHRQRRL